MTSKIVPTKMQFEEACDFVQNHWDGSSPGHAFNQVRIIALYMQAVAERLDAHDDDSTKSQPL